MLYSSPSAFLNDPRKAITVFGMSGVGKTTVANKLPKDHWFHYSVDYRIGTHYLGEAINDQLKIEAMKLPSLATLLKSDSIYIGSNIQVDNLAPLSAYIGMLGKADNGGLSLTDFKVRQAKHRRAEIQSLLDVSVFRQKASLIYDYPHFLADTGGSLIEVIDLDDPEDLVVKALTDSSLLVYIEADQDLMAEIVKRGIADPKPMYYQPDFLDGAIARFLEQEGLEHADQLDPKTFVAWVLAELMGDRAPRYARLAGQHGITVSASQVAALETEQDFLTLVANTIAEQQA